MNIEVEILKAARELIRDPLRWTQGWYAKTAGGRMVSVDDSQAVCFCGVGAIAKISGCTAADAESSESYKMLFSASGEEFSFIDFNDNHDHGEVLSMFDRAIERASS